MVVSITLPSKLSNANRCNGNIKKIFILQIFQQCSLFQCIDPSWYLSVDMQLFILSPLILIPLKKWPKYVLPVMVTLVGLGVAIPFWIGYSNKLTGIMLGWVYFKLRSTARLRSWARLIPSVLF